MFLLHQVLPHIHHAHESVEYTSLIPSEHSHNEDHHHNDDSSNNEFDLLGLLLGNHTHSNNGHPVDNLVIVKSIAKQQSTERLDTVAEITQLDIFANKLREIEKQIFLEVPPDPARTPHLSSDSSRAPPVLG